MNSSISTFGLDVYKLLSSSSTKDENIFFSPASIFTALSMTYCGTRNETASQMKDIMKLSDGPNEDEVHSQLQKLWNSIDQSLDIDRVQLQIANRLWIQKTYPIKEEFQTKLSNYYDADACLLNFVDKSEESRLSINEWVEEKTKQKIKDLLGPGSITPLTRLVLTNAIYFKGKWKLPFKTNKTATQMFHSSKDVSFKVDMMYQKARFVYTEVEEYDCKALFLPYIGCGITMAILLPNEIDGLGRLEEAFTKSGIDSNNLFAWSKTRPQEVNTHIPRFKITKSCSLNNVLKSMGMSHLFSFQSSDLSGISESNDLFVSEVVHKAFVEVNEEGTEAAAATGVIMMTRCALPMLPIPEFRANHPFMFMLYDSSSEVILFIGRVCNPNA